MRFSAAAFADDEGHFPEAEELIAGERVCAPAARGRNIVARIYAVLAVGVALVVLSFRPMPELLGSVKSLRSQFMASGTEPGAAQLAAASTPPAPVTEQSVPDLAPVAGPLAAAPAQDAVEDQTRQASVEKGDEANSASQSETEDRTTTNEIARPEPLAAPRVDPADYLLVKALAAGLNPELSRTLLGRLSAVDYKNADEAIHRALGSASNADVVLWPKRQQRRLAQFEVHFVQSASPDCRRYVVKVAKDGWATTAPPMEKCGFASG